MDDSEASRYDYRAFISYSHHDDAWARWLIGKLETYRVPAGIGHPDGDASRSLGRFFRDRDEASASEDLATTIRAALAGSEHMIVLASPAAARSKYVESEIREFAALNARRETPGRILTLIVDGAPNVSGTTASGEDECFPPALRGGLANVDGSAVEPLAADARPTGDGRTRALSKLVSGLLGVRYDLLVRRDLTRRRRQRVVIAAASAALVLATGIVGWRIETDRRERERLAEESALIERERRTLAAVNDAERAAELLDGGEIDQAVALARGALVVDGSIPVIPRAFDVLYRARTTDVAPFALELGGNLARTHALDDGQFITRDSTVVRVWGPGATVSSSRADLDFLDDTLTTALDGSAAFVTGAVNELRYRTADRTWDDIFMPEIEGGPAVPLDLVSYVATDASTLHACTEEGIVALALPQASGVAELLWQASLGEDGCRGLALAPDGTLLVELYGGAMLEFDVSERAIRARYAPPEAGWSWETEGDPVSFAGEHFLVRGQPWALYERGQAEPLHRIEVQSTDPVAISLDGRYVAATNSRFEGDDLHILDLSSGEERSTSCLCSAVGFDTEGRLLVRDHEGTVRSYDPDTLQVTGEVHRFSRPPDEVVYLPQAETLIGYNGFGLDEVVPAIRDVRKGFAAIGGAGTLLTHGLLLGDAVVAYGRAMTAPDTLSVSHDAHVVDMSAGAPRVVWESGPLERGAQLEALADDLLMVAVATEHENWPAQVSLIDAGSGEVAFSDTARSRPGFHEAGHMLVMETEEGLLQVRLGAGTSDIVRREELDDEVADWGVVAGQLLIARQGSIAVTDLASGAPRLSIPVDGDVLHLCAAPDGGALYVLSLLADGLRFVKWSIGDETVRSAQIDLSVGDEAGLIDHQLVRLAAFDRGMRGDMVACDGDILVVGFEGDSQLAWDSVTNTHALRTELGPEALPEGEAAPGEVTEADLAASRAVRRGTKAMLLSPAGRLLFATPDLRSPVRTARYIADRRWLVVGLENGRVMAWDMSLGNNSPVVSLDAHVAYVGVMDVNAAATVLLTGDTRGIRLWPILTPEELLALHAE